MKKLIFLGSLLALLGGLRSFAAIGTQATVSGKVVGIESHYIRVSDKGSIHLAPKPQQVKLGEQVSITFDNEEFKKQLKKY